MPGLQLQYSKSEVNRAGNVLRQKLNADLTFAITTPEEFQELLAAGEVAYHFRACHAYPLQKVTMGLRSAVATETARRPIVAQRFKRFPSMLNKLLRYPDMSLARMQDIGGCRAILRNGDEVRRVLRRIRRNWRPPDNRIKDYIATPAASGYRGIHVNVERDSRLIEVQLRTPIQHEWAIAVERMGARHGFDLKSGWGYPLKRTSPGQRAAMGGSLRAARATAGDPIRRGRPGGVPWAAGRR